MGGGLPARIILLHSHDNRFYAPKLLGVYKTNDEGSLTPQHQFCMCCCCNSLTCVCVAGLTIVGFPIIARRIFLLCSFGWFYLTSTSKVSRYEVLKQIKLSLDCTMLPCRIVKFYISQSAPSLNLIIFLLMLY